MPEIVEKTLKELFELLEYKKEEISTVLAYLLELIGKEALQEMKEGVHKDFASGVQSLNDASSHIDSNAILKIVETASSRVLVNYYAENKKDFNEKQKEIFLTFLLTNKLQRELEKNN